jgi:hypothetical protein
MTYLRRRMATVSSSERRIGEVARLDAAGKRPIPSRLRRPSPWLLRECEPGARARGRSPRRCPSWPVVKQVGGDDAKTMIGRQQSRAAGDDAVAVVIRVAGKGEVELMHREACLPKGSRSWSCIFLIRSRRFFVAAFLIGRGLGAARLGAHADPHFVFCSRAPAHAEPRRIASCAV